MQYLFRLYLHRYPYTDHICDFDASRYCTCINCLCVFAYLISGSIAESEDWVTQLIGVYTGLSKLNNLKGDIMWVRQHDVDCSIVCGLELNICTILAKQK